MSTQLLWLRSDLRVHDNPALASALRSGPTVACFIVTAKQWRKHEVGDARIAFVLRTLAAMKGKLAEQHIPLKILYADKFSEAPSVLLNLMQSLHAQELHFNAEYPINESRRDQQVQQRFQDQGYAVNKHHGSLILEPGLVLTGDQRPYTVFTPFKRRWLAKLETQGAGLLNEQSPVKPHPGQQALSIEADEIPLEVDGANSAKLQDMWPAGEDVALKRLTSFCTEAVARYQKARDIPALPGTSTLSPYLSVGSLSPKRCFAAAGVATAGDFSAVESGPSTWLTELIWREFYRHVIAQFPHVSKALPFKRHLNNIGWRYDKKNFLAWCKGLTGYPIVDAAQRQLLATGWMHNRLRMISAMFLTKHLLIDWRWGEAHFMRYLVDGDFASNNGGWQWSASTGTDAAPYFRIFNPITQAKRFDPNGEFVKHYIPELKDISGKGLFEPWKVTGHRYAAPIVDHKFARERALAAFKT